MKIYSSVSNLIMSCIGTHGKSQNYHLHICINGEILILVAWRFLESENSYILRKRTLVLLLGSMFFNITVKDYVLEGRKVKTKANFSGTFIMI